MKQKDYPKLGDSVFYDTLDNGLKLFINTKPEFKKTFISLSVDYGSIDNTFISSVSNKKIILPSGVAHFLEHKMFDKDGYDVDDVFDHYGANSNAFTSFTNTSYVIELMDHLKENLNTLLDFVQIPFFSQEKVDREKGIIEQEVKMYNDDPETQLYNKTVQNLYPDFPLNQDVAGTVDSICKITVDDLFAAYNNFYVPSNMKLVVSGDVDPENILKIVSDNQAKKHFKYLKKGTTIFDQASQERTIPSEVSNFKLSQSKASIGIKGLSDMGSGLTNLKNELIMNMLVEILISDHSRVNSEMYKQELIDDSFGWECENEREFHFIFIASDTDHPDEFIKKVKDTLLNAQNELKNKHNELQLIKREWIGKKIMALDSLEQLTIRIGDEYNQYCNMYDEIELVNTIELTDLISMAKKIFKEENMTFNIIK